MVTGIIIDRAQIFEAINRCLSVECRRLLPGGLQCS